MKNEFLEILNYELKDSLLKKDKLEYAEKLIDFYEKNRLDTKNKIKSILKKYNFDAISKIDSFVDDNHITLFHGSGGLEFGACLDSEERGEIIDLDNEFGTIIKEPEIWIDENKYSTSLSDEMDIWAWEIRIRVVFVWLSTIWQEIKGYDYGIIVKTLENNSARMFIFNDLLWEDDSIYALHNYKGKRLTRHFDRDMTIEEIDERVKLRFNH